MEKDTLKIDKENLSKEDKMDYIKDIKNINANIDKKIKKETNLTNIKILIFLIMLIFEIGVIASIFFHKSNNSISDAKKSISKIAIININKKITSKLTDNLMNKMDKIYKESKNGNKWKEILIVMNSGGGSPAASEEFSEYLKDYNKNKLKVNMYVENIAASGAYYIASAIKPLQSNRNAILGSIGVIMPHYNIKKLSGIVGIEEDNIAYGKYKEPVSSFKKVDEKSKKYLNKHLLKPAYNNFINRVSENRGIKLNELEKFANGKIFIASMKKIKNILVDKITTKIEIKNKLKEKYGDKTLFLNINKTNNNGIWKFLKNKTNFNINLKLNEDSKLQIK